MRSLNPTGNQFWQGLRNQRRPQRAVIKLAGLSCILALAVSTLLAIPSVHAAATATPIAGTLSDGPLVNDIPATLAQFWNPADVTVISDGTIYIADKNHNQVRKIGADHIIHAAFGDGVSGCGTGDTQTRLATPGSLAKDQHDNIYVATACGEIVKFGPTDAVGTVVAGKFDGTGNGNPVTHNGMVARSVTILPSALTYDTTSDTLYFYDSATGRVLKLSGGLLTIVAGTGSLGFSGDGQLATAAQFSYINNLLFANGNLYIADTGNCRVRVVTPDGIVSTVIGDGICHDANDTGPALSASVEYPGPMTIGADNTLYLAGSLSGSIFAYDTASHNLSSVIGIISNTTGLAMTPGGNLLALHSGINQRLFEITGLVQPPVLPVVVDISVNAPQQSDPLLTRGVHITPADNGVTIDHYVYGWSSNIAATQPDSAFPVQSSSSTDGRLNFSVTMPDSDWFLFARAFTAGGQAGPWSAAKKVHTPPAPVLVVGGDSISAGHHLLPTDPHTFCEDKTYGYASFLAFDWLGELPTNWQIQPDPFQASYRNFAFSGFSVVPHKGSKTGSMTGGGKDACGNPAGIVPITSITNELAAHKGSWNRFVGTVGIDDTNWSQALVSTTGVVNVFGLSRLPGVQSVVCSAHMRAAWNGYDPAIKTSITDGIKQIMSAIQTADPTVSIDMLSYYNIAGTGVVPAACSPAVNDVMTTMSNSIKAGLPANARFDDISGVMSGHAELMQPLFAGRLTLNIVQLTGWPHPNQDGGEAIANAIPH